MSSAAPKLPAPPLLPSEPPRPSVTYSEAFWRAMATLPAHGVPESLATRALMTWWRIASARPPEPAIEVPEGAVRFTWSYDDAYLHLDVREDGFEWFRSGRAPEDFEGTVGAPDDPPDATVTDAFFRALADLREGRAQ